MNSLRLNIPPNTFNNFKRNQITLHLIELMSMRPVGSCMTEVRTLDLGDFLTIIPLIITSAQLEKDNYLDISSPSQFMCVVPDMDLPS